MDLELEIDKYISREEALGIRPTITGLARHLRIPSKTLLNLSADDERYEIVQLAIDRIASHYESKMDPTKWMNIVAKWIAVERQEVQTDGGLNIKINSDRNNNL